MATWPCGWPKTPRYCKPLTIGASPARVNIAAAKTTEAAAVVTPAPNSAMSTGDRAARALAAKRGTNSPASFMRTLSICRAQPTSGSALSSLASPRKAAASSMKGSSQGGEASVWLIAS